MALFLLHGAVANRPGPPIVLTAGQQVEMRIDEREVVDDVAPEIFVLQVSRTIHD